VIRIPAAVGFGAAFLLSGCILWSDFASIGIGSGASGGTGGSGGNGGVGGSGGVPLVCEPSESRECYTGPMDTKGKGICQVGQETCNADGTGFEGCTGDVLPKEEDCATPLDENCDGIANSCSGEVLWAQRFGDSKSQFARATTVDSLGNIVVVGSFLGSVSFGGQELAAASPIYADVFVAKFDSAGSHQWSSAHGKTLAQRARSVATDSQGNVVVVGDFDGSIAFGGDVLSSAGGSDVFVVQFDASGQVKWSKSYGSTGQQTSYSVATNGDGEIVLSGAFSGEIDFGLGAHTSIGATDVFVTKLTSAGAAVWSKTFGLESDQSVYGLVLDSGGNVLLTGGFGGTIKFGQDTHTSVGGVDVFVAKLDPEGTTLWSRSFGTDLDQVGNAVAVDDSGNVTIAGTFSGEVDFGAGIHKSAGGSDVFVAHLGADGETKWSKRFGDAKDGQTAYCIKSDQFGNVVFGGAFDGSIDFGDGTILKSGGGADIFLAKLSLDGTTVWSRRFGDEGIQTVQGLALDSDGNTVMAGYLDGTVDVGSQTLTSSGAEDVVLAKIAP
jgi:hypothetical protein